MYTAVAFSNRERKEENALRHTSQFESYMYRQIY